MDFGRSMHDATVPHYRGQDPILGIEAVPMEDRVAIERLMFYSLVIKCPGTDYDAAYDRPTWWRVEARDSEFLLLLGGWDSLAFSHLRLIMGYDTKTDARNLVSLEMTRAPSNTNPHARDLTLVLHYRPSSIAGRSAALGSKDAADPAPEPRGTKKRGVAALANFVWTGEF